MSAEFFDETSKRDDETIDEWAARIYGEDYAALADDVLDEYAALPPENRQHPRTDGVDLYVADVIEFAGEHGYLTGDEARAAISAAARRQAAALSETMTCPTCGAKDVACTYETVRSGTYLRTALHVRPNSAGAVACTYSKKVAPPA